MQQEEGGKPFDIYHDPLVSEALACLPVLRTIRTRVQQLLAEWEEHPTLNEMTLLIDRLLDMPATSPIIKLVTGLEVLYQKAQVHA